MGCRPAGGVRVRKDKLTVEELTAAVGLRPEVMTVEIKAPCYWRLLLERVDAGKTNLQYLNIDKSCSKVRLVTLVASDPQTATLKGISCEFQGLVDDDIRTSIRYRLELEAGMFIQGFTWNNSLPSPMTLTLARTNGTPTSVRFVIETNSVAFREM